MKILTLVLAILAVAIIAYNITVLDFSNLLGKDSSVALISIIACICAILLLLILHTSKRIERKIKENK
ncbi:MAG: hypothetical protein COZ75_10860 [Flavobacteriaceae bacterium CG_4_8_14_3_um_filter_34_10]|nr:MAG: hypothetical protein AUK33_06470 [Flavobacteriaceae bacterium CG2_30_34_30]PIQ19374.1 MAG: hypothetical protein COW66_01350 [Flavobacteriaceae bacterium CG18_big_fil_WC_8_21_14_2_50_34_36]PIX08645.1 MAG: hypothetical protein COZ75_10860 [Flavobacteriaceae bacterium CG_4_8_14_3_um_filter_34_10]PJC06005.1 MAG: hypothetical protein CO068_13325 [Flavobacteriaceae bacterium CG_4_9_14_0_8_um_filter_34_30]